MLNGASPEEREKLHLGPEGQGAGGGFHYISQSGCYSRLDGANDADDYRYVLTLLPVRYTLSENGTSDVFFQ